LFFPDYHQLVEILTQRPLDAGMKFRTKLNEQDMRYMTEMARQRFDKVMEALRAMPRTMLLVIRWVQHQYFQDQIKTRW
jgi:aarF domain-containing kinase